MNHTISIPGIREFMTRHFAEVFGTSLSLEARPAPSHTERPGEERVTGSVGFAGEHITGAVYLHLSSPFACQATAAMLGISTAEISGEGDVNDAVGEITNMLAGGLKSWLCDEGAPCAVSTPAIIRGTAFAIEASPEIDRDLLAFDCGGESVLVEIHVKLN